MPEFKYCPECGHLLSADAGECSHCGQKVGRSADAQRRLRIILAVVAIDVVMALVVVAVLLATR